VAIKCRNCQDTKIESVIINDKGQRVITPCKECKCKKEKKK